MNPVLSDATSSHAERLRKTQGLDGPIRLGQTSLEVDLRSLGSLGMGNEQLNLIDLVLSNL